MTDQTPPPQNPPADRPPVPPKDGEIPLEDIDKFLAEEDPEFVKEMGEMRAIESDASVVIETSVAGDDVEGEANIQVEGLTRLQKLRERFRLWRVATRAKLKARARQAIRDLVVFLKTKPKLGALWLAASARYGAHRAAIPVRAFRAASRARQLTILLLVGLVAAALAVLVSNFKGGWIPHLTEPILANLEGKADWVARYDPKAEGESFYSAFPQEIHQFLFPKMKVNLRRTAEHPLPMGAFEVVVQLDSKDTAIEMRDREIEFFDQLQRVFEDQVFEDLVSELGKTRLKTQIKREFNQKLTQGWVKDVSFATFVLKP